MTPTSAPDLPGEIYRRGKEAINYLFRELQYCVDTKETPAGYSQAHAEALDSLDRLGQMSMKTNPQSEASAEALELAEIRERWKSRAWPSIGYFVHGQAYQDIQKLLEIIDGK